LQERVTLVVRDSLGRSQPLRLEGATQLILIREFLDTPSPPLLEISFREGGNCEAYLGPGWSYQERAHRWCVDDDSFLEIPSFPHKPMNLEMLVWPFTGGRVNCQSLEVFQESFRIASFEVARHSLLKCPLPFPLQTPGVLRFAHPDAASPAEIGISSDPRRLAIAFKKIRIVSSWANRCGGNRRPCGDRND
jgi:hypothetical protein